MKVRVSEHPAPAGVSPAIAAVWTEYFGPGLEAPCRSLRDIAAKALFVIHAQNEIGGLTSAEDEVRASVLAAVLALTTASFE